MVQSGPQDRRTDGRHSRRLHAHVYIRVCTEARVRRRARRFDRSRWKMALYACEEEGAGAWCGSDDALAAVVERSGRRSGGKEGKSGAAKRRERIVVV